MRASGAKAWGFESSTPEVTQKCVDQRWRHVLLPSSQGPRNEAQIVCRALAEGAGSAAENHKDPHRDTREPHLGTPPLNKICILYNVCFNVPYYIYIAIA